MNYECQNCGKQFEEEMVCPKCKSSDVIAYNDDNWYRLKKRLEWMITDKNGKVNRESGEGIRISMVLDIMESLEEE